ncbi:MAG: hypothetical protein OXE42_01305 [Gammaproteobacteria bacterium]|nr:hypothetical protein [Gammaproteobacteria bacterium]
MLKSQELSLKLSEKRSRLNELNFKDDKSETELNELDEVTKIVQGLEVEYRGAVVAEDAALDDAKTLFDDDGEAAEIRQIKGRALVQNYAIASMERRAIKGAEAELNAALKIDRPDRVPLILLAGAEPETRSTTDVSTSTSPRRRWLDRLFAGTAAAHLGITMDSVGTGVASYPVVQAGGSGARRGREEAAEVAAWQVGTTELKPGRSSIHLEFSKEDDLRIAGLNETLIRDMRSALTESIDRAIFLGDDGANENQADIIGLNTAAGITETTLTQANKINAAETLRSFNGLIDGIHAGDLADLKTVASEGAYQLWTGQVLNVPGETASVFKTMAQFLNDSRVMWKVRQLEPATTENTFGAFISRSMGLPGAGIAPTWDSAELVIDKYSKAKSGMCLLTLTTFWNFALPRPSNFARLKFVA